MRFWRVDRSFSGYKRPSTQRLGSWPVVRLENCRTKVSREPGNGTGVRATGRQALWHEGPGGIVGRATQQHSRLMYDHCMGPDISFYRFHFFLLFSLFLCVCGVRVCGTCVHVCACTYGSWGLCLGPPYFLRQGLSVKP